MMYLIVKKCSSEKQLDDHYEFPDSEYANDIMHNKEFINYIKNNGYHFSDKLAEYTSNMMKNANNSSHSWNSKTVKETLGNLGLTDYNKNTIGDLMYLANMAYADFYPEVLNNETACIKYAYAVAHDKDGYEGIAFSRWLADIINKHITDIKWENYI